MKKLTTLITLSLFTFLLGSIAHNVEANHSWGKYHWDLSTAETLADPLDIGDNLSGGWSTHLTDASVDWNNSVLKSEVATGLSNSNCDPTLGRVEVCNAAYGDNGWLGIAQIWAYRGRDAHIAQAIVKLNDTYFALPKYNDEAWRQFVMCQEVGHTFGLDHQDENFSNLNLGTCMDYTSEPTRDDGAGANLHPNQHDFEELQSIYAHLNEPTNKPGGDKGGNGNGGGNGKGKNKTDLPSVALNGPAEWGHPVAQDSRGRNSQFIRSVGNNIEIITHVIWAQ